MKKNDSAIALIELYQSVPFLSKLNNYGKNGLNRSIQGCDVGNLIKGYKDLKDLLPSTDIIAFCEQTQENSFREPLTHKRLKNFITNEFKLNHFSIPNHSRVAIIMPNGPELAVTMIGVVSSWCAAPINLTNTWQEIKAELESTKSIAMIIMTKGPNGNVNNESALKAASELGIGIITIEASDTTTGLFELKQLKPINPTIPNTKGKLKLPNADGFMSFDHPEIVLLLHTSGTSGNKKLVPYSLDMIMVGVGCIISSWNLSPSDVCLNMMPLYHIGGIIRNVFSPILSGGAVIACSGFDPVVFWDVLYSGAVAVGDKVTWLPSPTWYYASPTMHHAILAESEVRPKPLPIRSIRYIANAAGGLLPVLAKRLKDTFDAVILTSYGMTECMPISSPPQDYDLAPTGTSGIPVGVDIMIVDEELNPICSSKHLSIHKKGTGIVGNIFVRGPPCFGGYEDNEAGNKESFFIINSEPGWFNTGDTGCLDAEGYLFISGRSKEIINRGGETISPFEIEEVIVQHPNIKEVLAFSTPHSLFQETVGVILVSKLNYPRIDLNSLNHYLESRLHHTKWPQVVVYSDALPKNNVGKILRLKFAERSNIPAISSGAEGAMNTLEPSTIKTQQYPILPYLYEMKCPPIGTPLTTKIVLQPIYLNLKITQAFVYKLALESIPKLHVDDISVLQVDLQEKKCAILVLIKISKDTEELSNKTQEQLISTLEKQCKEVLDGFLRPHFFLIADHNDVPTNEMHLKHYVVELYERQNTIFPRNNMEKDIELIWRSYLKIQSTISVTQSFFNLGGDSLKAGQLVNAIRKKMKVPLSVTDLFANPTIESLAIKLIRSQNECLPSIAASGSSNSLQDVMSSKSYSMAINNYDEAIKIKKKFFQFDDDNNDQEADTSMLLLKDLPSVLRNTSFSCLLVQSLPIVVFIPMERLIAWYLFIHIWVALMSHLSRIVSLVLTIIIIRMIMNVMLPMIAIISKWVIIGHYKPGRNALWGTMYLKVWIVDQIIMICGKGIFSNDFPYFGSKMNILYYTLMGAKIGKNVKISDKSQLRHFDLITIHDNCAIDDSILTPFSLEEGYFILLPIVVKENSSVCLKSILAPGSELPSNTTIGPLSSSYEKSSDDCSNANAKYCRLRYGSPPDKYVYLIGYPIMLVLLVINYIPYFFLLELMVKTSSNHSSIDNIYAAMKWWTSLDRIAFFFLIRIVNRAIMPFINLFLVILIKRNIIGKFKPMSSEEGIQPWNRFRYWLMNKILPPKSGFLGVARMVGTHYEIISIIYRLLGSKIGQRVYWPGSGMDIIQYDLFEVGDDAVFGSRSAIITLTVDGSCKPVVIEEGCMVADRCVLLPGTILKRGSVLGSGGLTPEDFIAPVGSVWIGSKDGKCINVAEEDKSFLTKDLISPFGKAFYQRNAAYTVIPLWGIILYSCFWRFFCICYKSSKMLVAQVICIYMHLDNYFGRSSPSLCLAMLVIYLPLSFIYINAAFLIVIISKWLLLGHRKVGEYSWDKSSYCQRWQILLTIEQITYGMKKFIQGSLYIVLYFRALGAMIGTNVCLYPMGADPMMTEPDLVTVGDYSSVDNCSLVSHINTRGTFKLNAVIVGSGCVLKAFTRVLSGASLESDSIILEHTLVMAGDIVERGIVRQGWPCDKESALVLYRQDIQLMLDKALGEYMLHKREKRKHTNRSRDNIRQINTYAGVHMRESMQVPNSYDFYVSSINDEKNLS